jgi:transposase
MPTPQREPLRRLTRAERTALQRIVKSTSERVDQVRRAAALLAVARTGVYIQAAREAGLHSGTTVADLVARFNRHGLAAVRIARGRGRKLTYAVAARAQMVATAQRSPNRRTDGTATWSLSTLQRTLRRQSFPTLSTSTIRRVLQDAGSSDQRTRTWCPTGTAQRKRKTGVVTVVDPQTEVKSRDVLTDTVRDENLRPTCNTDGRAAVTHWSMSHWCPEPGKSLTRMPVGTADCRSQLGST